MQKKYLNMEVKKNDDASVPVGWASRSNNLTLSEMSNSKNSTAIAVAEVSAMNDSNTTNSLFVGVNNTNNNVSNSSSSSSSSSSSNNNNNNYNNNNIKINEENTKINEGITNINQMVSMLAGAFVQMDSRMKSMEDKLNVLYSRTDEVCTIAKRYLYIDNN
jgi:hypothetical protein